MDYDFCLSKGHFLECLILEGHDCMFRGNKRGYPRGASVNGVYHVRAFVFVLGHLAIDFRFSHTNPNL